MTGPPAVDLVVVGASWGGMDAAVAVLRVIPPPLRVPVLLVLHRGRTSDSAILQHVIARESGHPTVEVGDKDALTAGTVHLAPADYHVLVEGGTVSLSVEDPVNHSRPSVDVALETAAEAHRDRLVAVLLSGLGRDGACGAQAVRARGGQVFVQDPDEAERPDMPLAVITAGAASHVAPAAEIGARVGELLGGAAR